MIRALLTFELGKRQESKEVNWYDESRRSRKTSTRLLRQW
jgi:hypothetical protein